MRKALPETKEKFLDAALSELYEYGVAGFSIRNVAKRCGVTCAAPYRHYQNKTDLIHAVVDAVTEKWRQRVLIILEKHPDDFHTQLVEICVDYVRFLCETPGYFTVAVMNEKFLSAETVRKKSLISNEVLAVISNYCTNVNLDETAAIRKTFFVRAFILGAAEMITSEVLPFNEATLEMVRSCVEREFQIA